MKKRTIILGAVGVILAVAGALAVRSVRSGAEAFQRDADVVRLSHLLYYGELLREYQAKAGRYPFQEDADLPVYVHVAHSIQRKYISGGPPYPHRVVPAEGWISEIERVLGRTVEERYDPQYAPAGRPNFYVYMAHQGGFFFAVHVSREYPFARVISPGYHKVEISNVATAENGSLDVETFLQDARFLRAANAPLARPSFFAQRQAEHRHSTKEPARR
jgi:hypothetical protein